MGTIFETQDWLRIRLSYVNDIASSIKSGIIKYEKPDGTTGQWTGTHDAATKSFYYDLPQGSALGVSTKTLKRWKFWLVLTANDDRTAPGEVVTELIKAEGSTK